MFVNLVLQMEARNIAQCFFFILLNLVRILPKHVGNFSRTLEMMQCHGHKPVTVTKYFLKAEPLLKLSSAADCNKDS